MAAETREDFIARIKSPWPNGWLGRRVTTKDIGRAGWGYWVVEAITLMPQTSLPEKVLSIERIRFDSFTGEAAYAGGAQVGDREYRFSYFMRGRIGRALGMWTWGQFSPFIPAQDLRALLAKATAEGTFLT